jgi:hypothetical protein
LCREVDLIAQEEGTAPGRAISWQIDYDDEDEED